ncbi:DNase I-like protein [Mycena sp. CBHHK59/15]|nr:DNase I-like protein [Mycena sp. CBHHK59/15]
MSPSTSTPNTSERKTFGSSRLPPPPTRTIALGEKLPPVRRPPSPSSDEESGEDEAPSPDLPDSSRSSRRPPHLSFRTGYVGPSEPKIPVPAHQGHAIVSGTRVVVATHHHVRIYDVALSDVPVHNLDKREIGHGHGIKDLKVTCMEYRPCSAPEDRGCLLWLGTKDGHLIELDVRSGLVTAVKPAAHLHAVIRIFRHGRSMVTLDDAGKTLLFSPDGADIQLAFTTPRVARITEKQDFAQLVAGKLWTAQRAELHAARVQTIRVFDLFVPGAPGRSVQPLEAVGAVTSATILPSQPGVVYVGHEAGSVSLWTMDDGGWPRCIEVVRVSTSDVLCLEGVNNRLWAGGRSGMISAYDVSVKPWLVTNCWMAHSELPVKELAVDHYGIEKTGRLCVVSVGRDEQVKLWDGLLASDWVDQELMKREASFSTFRDLSVLIISWNADNARPDSLTGEPGNINFLHGALNSVECPDIITFGLQEVVDLESRKMVAKNVLLGRKDKQDASVAQITGLSGLSEKVTGAYRRWYEYLVLAVRLAMPAQVPYTVIHTESLIGLFTCVFVKNSTRVSVKDNVITSMKRGLGGRYGNKGGIITRLVIEDSSICFINCHLAAGQHATRARNADIAAMLEERSLLPPSESGPLAYVGGGDGQMALDHEIVFINGDMNYRIDQRRDHIIAAVRANELESLLAHDQLLKEIKYNRGCRLRGFLEGPLTFAPTYKYDRHSTEYDSSEKARAPAWCDRVLWRTRTPNRVKQLHYQRYEANVSDHRPVSAAFKFTVKSIRHEVLQKAKGEVQIQWAGEQERLLSAARDFYVERQLI